MINVFLVNRLLYPAICSFFINPMLVFSHVLIELTSPKGEFYHDANAQRHIRFWLLWGFSSYLWDKRWNNKFKELNEDRTFCFIFWEWLVFREFVCLTVRSWFKLQGTFLNGFDNIFYLNGGQFDVNWRHWEL